MLGQVDPRIWQAVVAGLFVAGGWIYNGWQVRRAADRLRREKLRDSHRALYAEIGANLANLGSVAALERHGQTLVERMEADADFVPFIPIERSSPVFRALIESLHILPRTSIDPVVAYYSQIDACDALARDMREDRFATLSVERRIAIYRDYIEMKKQAFAFGNYALRMIAAYAAGGRDEALRVEALSNPGAGRSGP